MSLLAALVLSTVSCGGDGSAPSAAETPAPSQTGGLSVEPTATATPEPASPATLVPSPAAPAAPTLAPSYRGAIVGTVESDGGMFYLVESATGHRFRVTPAQFVDREFRGPVVFVIGRISGSGDSIRAERSETAPTVGSTGCGGTLVERGGRLYVDGGQSSSDCQGIELLEVPADVSGPLLGQPVLVRVLACTATRDGRVVNPRIHLAAESVGVAC